MYDELVKRLRDAAKMCEALTVLLPHSEGNATAKLYNEAADAIEDLVALNVAVWDLVKHVVELDKPSWIPVSERLPEYDREVLVFVKNRDPNGRFNKDGIYTAVLRNKVPEHDPEGKKNFWGLPGYDSVWTVWSWSYFTEPDVLYWMPLPEPPKEE